MSKTEQNCKSECNDKECDDNCMNEDCNCDESNCGKANGSEGSCKENIFADPKILAQKYDELQKQYIEVKTTLQRIYAEFQNYKKRTEEDKVKFKELSNEKLIKNIIPIIDNFENAIKHRKQNEKHNDEYSKGMELIYQQLVQLIEDEGVKIIPSKGKFDPNFHEVLMVEPSDKEEGTILEEFVKGYIIGGKVIRHSKVKIAKHK